MSENTKTYYYTPKGDHLTLFRGKKKLHTPKGNVVVSYSESLAQLIIQELEANADYTSCTSLLCYHYTYCDLIADYDTEAVRADLLSCIDANVEDDALLMFGHDDDDIEDVIKTTARLFKAHVLKCNIYQLSAIIVLFVACESILLPWLILQNADNTTAFITQLKNWCKDEEISMPHDMQTIISKFTQYYTI